MSVTLVLQAVVRVNDKTFYATPSDKKAGFFKNCVEPVIFLWADKEKVRVQIFFYLTISGERQVLTVKVLSRELLNQF